MKHTTRNTRFSMIAVAVVGALVAGNAAASGFQIRENSTKNVGRALTGTAVAKDGSSVLNNPAAMTHFKSTNLQLDVAGIDLDATFTGTGYFKPTATTEVSVGGGNGGDPGELTAVPAMSLIVPLKGSLENVRIGASVTAPFGLKTEYENGWMGRYNATISDLKTVDLTLSVGVEFSDKVSVGAGVIFQRAEVELGRDIPMNLIISGLPAPLNAPVGDGNFTITGKDNAVGFVAGIMLRPTDKLTIGYSHRTEIKHKFTGTADFTMPNAFTARQPGLQTLSANAAAAAANTSLPPATRATYAAQAAQLGALGYGFQDGEGYSELTTPAVDTVSVAWGINDRVTLYGELQRTGWESLQNVTVGFANRYQATSVEQFNWKDSWYYGIGADFKLNDAFTLRAGVGYDETPTNDADRTPRLPDNNRNIFTAGGSWNVSQNISIDFAYMRVNVKKTPVNLAPNAAEGRYTGLRGQFSGHADVFSVGGSYSF